MVMLKLPFKKDNYKDKKKHQAFAWCFIMDFTPQPQTGPCQLRKVDIPNLLVDLRN